MKIVNRKEFLLMPPGTVYSRYEPQIVIGFEIKGNSITNDWFYQNILGETEGDSTTHEYENMEAGSDVPLYLNVEQRDGGYEQNAMFLIYTSEDIRTLIEELETC